ncbi:MAG: hypothetical protein PHY93_05535 [Bacteriovorax sp.]|nr:hypothetical protein [Bacteriovorax sp.]
MIKKSFIFLLLVATANAGAHCPTAFKLENICMMLDQNVIFVYDQKEKHSGPYKDFKESSFESIKSNGRPLKFSKIARGVYRIESAQPLKTVDIEMMNAKKKIPLKLTID